jgi:hypothetical protein
VTLDLSSPAFSGTTTVDSLLISNDSIADKQIIINRANNCRYLKAINNSNKLALGFGSSLTDWSNSTFDFYQTGVCKFPGYINANKFSLISRTALYSALKNSVEYRHRHIH